MNTDSIGRYVWNGRKDKNWYADCRAAFVDLFGEENIPLVTKLFAATSINTALKANVTLFRRAYYEIKFELPIGKYLPNIQNQLQYIREGGELSGRKINNFAKAMSGDTSAVVVDVWICRAFGLIVSSPSKKQYDEIEAWITGQASKMNLQPCELCAMIWSGVRSEGSRERDTKYISLLRSQLINLYGVI